MDSEQQTTAVNAIRDLSSHIPQNDLGMPTGFYRPDLLPFHDYIKPSSKSVTELNESRKTEIMHDLEVDGPQLYNIRNDDLESSVPVALLPEGFGHELVQELDDEDYDDNDGIPLEMRRLEDEKYVASQLRAPKPSDSSRMMVPIKAKPVIPEEEVDEEKRIAGFLPADLDQAFEWLSYDEGFPTQRTGLPFWDRLAYETPEAYKMFTIYLQMGTEALTESNTGNSRSIASLVQAHTNTNDSAETTQELLENIQELYTLYYWRARTTAYDMFRVAEYRRSMELRAVEVNNNHYLRAGKLLSRLDEYFQDDEGFWEEVTPKVAVDMLKTVSQIERLSAGMSAMNADSGGGGKDGPGVQSLEVHLRQQAHNQQQQQHTLGDDTVINGETGMIERVLSDPEVAGAAQELIIKLQMGGQG